MEDDWAEYHDEDWPGIEQVIEWSSPYLDEDGNERTRSFETTCMSVGTNVVLVSCHHRERTRGVRSLLAT